MLRRALLPAIALALALTATASAAELTPLPEARGTVGKPLDFVVPVPVLGSIAVITIAASPATDAAGDLREDRIVASAELEPDPLDPTVLRWRLPKDAMPVVRAGRYAWQARIALPGAGEPVTTEVRWLTMVAPAPWRSRTRIPRRFGRQGKGAFAVSLTGVPAGLSKKLFTATAATTARRWGLRAATTTRRRPGVADGHDVIGFGAGVPAHALGVQRDFVRERVMRRTRCTAAGCKVTDRVVSRYLERDVILRPDLPWWLGPEPPDMDHFDVESVLIHELGHFARNPRHTPACSNSPLAVSMGAGEWWRTPRDRWSSCGARAASAHGLDRPRRLGFAEQERVIRTIVLRQGA